MENKYFVHESSYIDENVEIGEGTKIWHFCHIQSGARIGRNCTIGQNVYVGSNVRIGNDVKIQNNVSVYEGVTLEDGVFCGPSCVFTNDPTPRARFPKGRENFVKTLVLGVAEMEKILENTYRNVNIGLINEIGRLCHEMGISVWEVIEAAKTKPYGFQAFYPGPGLGGHCIPLDPYYLTWKAREYGFHTTLIENSMVINDGQPEYCVERAMHILNRHKKAINGAKVLMLGVAYKNDIDDCRESPAIRVMRELRKVGADVAYYDPWVASFTNMYGQSAESLKELTPEVVQGFDLVMVTAAHHNVDYGMVQKNAKAIFDTKNVMAGIRERGNIEVL